MRYLVIILLALALRLHAQSNGLVRGVVKDPAGLAVAGASVRLKNAAAGFERSVTTDRDGAYVFAGLPLSPYVLTVEAAGFRLVERAVAVRSAVAVEMDVGLQLGELSTILTVRDAEQSLDPDKTGSYAQMNRGQIEGLALQASNRGLEAALLGMPGFVQNANGSVHPRGAHNQMTFVVDGMPVTEQLTGAFANSVDANAVETVEVFTGNIPAEYGNKAAAVANVSTKSGLGSGRRFGGTTTLAAGQFDLLSQTTQVFGERGAQGFSALVTAMKSHRYLDAVSLDNLHNGGNSTRAYLRWDGRRGERDYFRVSTMTGNSPFEMANLRSQQANGMRQRMRVWDGSGSIGWMRTVDPRTTVEATASYRAAGAELLPSEGDTPVTAEQERRTITLNTGGRVSRVWGRHTWRSGFDVQRLPVREHFAFGITDPGFNAPGTDGYNAALAAHDLSRGGRVFRFGDARTGAFDTGFLQDTIKLGRFTVQAGLRYDSYRFLVNGAQWQPRVGVSYSLRETGTVLRASYNRLYHTPPTENLLLSNSAAAAALAPAAVKEALGEARGLIRPERQNFFEAGLQQALGAKMIVSAAAYHKNGRDQQDNNNFFNTGVIFPISLARIRVNGVEGRWTLAPVRGFGAAVSVTHARAITTPPFTGGLYLGNDAIDALTAGPFRIDHDQALAVQSMVSYAHRSGWFANGTVRYDSGLVANPSDPAEVARDPDYSDLLPYVNLASDPARTRPRAITDVTAGYARMRGDKKRWEVSLQVANLTNATALFNFQSVFVGTRVVQPRTAAVRARWFF